MDVYSNNVFKLKHSELKMIMCIHFFTPAEYIEVVVNEEAQVMQMQST